MKLCATCGLEHPDHITTFHHPNGCPCGSLVLHAPDGNNQGPHGCVWSQMVQPPEDPRAAYLRLIRERHEADLKLANQKEH